MAVCPPAAFNSYCEINYTCCSIVGCCPSGTFCSGFKCISDIFSTQKPSTASLRTISFRTTLKPWTTFNPWTTSKPDYPRTYKPVTFYPTRRPYINTMKPSAIALRPWQYASIVTSVLVVIAVTNSVICLIRRSHRNRSNVQAQPGMTLAAPAQVYGQAAINNGTSYGVPSAYTNSPPNGTSYGVPPVYTNTSPNGTSHGVPPAYTNCPPIGTSHGASTAYTNTPLNGTSHGAPTAYTNTLSMGQAMVLHQHIQIHLHNSLMRLTSQQSQLKLNRLQHHRHKSTPKQNKYFHCNQTCTPVIHDYEEPSNNA